MTELSIGQVAPVSRRAVAYVIDALIAGGIGIVLGAVLAVAAVMAGPDGTLSVLAVGGPLVSLLLLGWFIVYTLMQSGKGSIGMRAQGLGLVRAADGTPLGFGTTLLRNIIFGLSAAIIVGYFTPLFDGSGRFQGWHDKVAKSLMVNTGRTSAPVGAPPTQAMAVVPHPPVPPHGPPPVPGLPATPEWPAAMIVPPRPSFVPPQPGSPDPTPPPAPAEQASWSAANTPVTPPAPEPVAAPASTAHHTPAPAFGVDDPLIAFVPGITQDSPPRTAPTTVATPGPGDEFGVPDETQLRGSAPDPDPFDLEETRISIPGHRLVFTWDDGTRVAVSQRTIFGRNPDSDDGAVLVSVRDETLSLSKTHFEAAAEASGGWVIDRHSTNGTTVVRDGQRIPCAPGERVRIRLGDAIEIGDRIVTIGGYA